MGKYELTEGMERMLNYHSSIVNDPDIKQMCMKCEGWMGEQHNYNDCKDCQGFKFYCELEEYRFADTFR